MRPLRWKPLWFFLAILPGALAFVPIVRGDPSVMADPREYLRDFAGEWAVIFFLLVSILTPLRVLFPKAKWIQDLNRHRRLIGVTAFFYALAHLVFYFLIEGFYFEDFTAENLFIWSGAVAFLILLLLAVTSPRWAMRKLGKRWKPVHRTAYLCAFLIFFHQALQEKAGFGEAISFFAPLAILQIARVAKTTWKKRQATP